METEGHRLARKIFEAFVECDIPKPHAISSTEMALVDVAQFLTAEAWDDAVAFVREKEKEISRGR